MNNALCHPLRDIGSLPGHSSEGRDAVPGRGVEDEATASKDLRPPKVSEDNLDRLRIESPDLAAEGIWCHLTPGPEPGGLLVATPRVSEAAGHDRYDQVVALLVEHGERGSIALILNRPTGMVLGKKPSGMPIQLSVSGKAL